MLSKLPLLLAAAAVLILTVTGQGTNLELRRLTREVSDLGKEVEKRADEVVQLFQELQQQLTVISRQSSKESNQIQQENSLQVAAQYLPSSCSELASGPPGYYQIRIPSSGEIVTVFCDTTSPCCNSTGGWMRVANLDTTDPTQQCPSGFKLKTDPKRVCVRTTDHDCTSIIFRVHGVHYSKVCGQVKGYQDSSVDAFGFRQPPVTVDDNYVDGVTITHGALPRQHIWTFAAALDETVSTNTVCPCTKTDAPYTGQVPPFVGNDYFCETGTEHTFEYGSFYAEDPLWDGEGCGPTSSCCQFNSPPWFCKELPQPTTDDIEVRVCTDEAFSNEDVAIELIELYLQ